MSEAKHFHPLALPILFFSRVKKWWLILLPLFPRLTTGDWRSLLILFALFLLNGGSAFLSYWFYRYQLTGDHLEITQGVFVKKRRLIPYERIQSIHQRQWFFLKPFHLVQLTVDTASGGPSEAEANLLAVPESLLLELEHCRTTDKEEIPNSLTSKPEPATEQLSSLVYEVTNRDIFLFSFTDLGLIPLFLAALSFMNQIIPENWMARATNEGELLLRSSWILFSVASILLLVCLMLASLIKQFVLFYRFRVTRSAQELHIESGLFERRTTIVPISKIQQIKLNQQFLRQILGLTTVQIILAGEQDKEDTLSGKLYLLPIISQKLVYRTLSELLPEYQMTEPTLRYVTAKQRPLLWYFWRWPLVILTPTILLIGLFFHWFAFIPTCLLIFFLITGIYQRNLQAFASHEKQCIIQTAHFLTKELSFIEHRRLQTFSVESSRWLFPKKRGHVTVTTLAGSSPETLTLRFLSLHDIERLQSFYTQSTTRHDVTIVSPIQKS